MQANASYMPAGFILCHKYVLYLPKIDLYNGW